MRIRAARGPAAGLLILLPACVAIPFDHPYSDGGGEGRVTLQPESVVASSEVHLAFRFRVGPSGLMQGGGFRIQLPLDPVHPFLGFTPPQASDRLRPGHVSCSALRGDDTRETAIAEVGDAGEVRCLVADAPLAPGDRLELGYWGLAPRVSGFYRLHAESRLTGGRGGRALAEPADLRVVARPARFIHAVVPSLARIGEPFTFALTALDEFGNPDRGFRATVEISLGARRLIRTFDPQDEAVALVSNLVLDRPGFHRATVVEQDAPGGHPIRTRSNPILAVAASSPWASRMILWGDLHFHTGTGAGHRGFLPPDLRAGDRRGNYTSQSQAFAYARDVMRLDFAAATEYATGFLDAAAWTEGVRSAGELDAPGRFTALEGFHWRDRLVLPAESGAGPVREDRRGSDQPDELAAALADRGMADAVTVLLPGAGPGGSARARELYSWRNRGRGYVDRKRRFEPAAGGMPAVVTAGTANHWGRPGALDLSGLEPGSGGLTAVVAQKNTREAILGAIRAGRAWATTGPRIFLDVRLQGDRLQVTAAGEDTLQRVELALMGRSGPRVIPLLERPAGELRTSLRLHDAGAIGYVRVIQRDGGMAWSSPFRVGPPETATGGKDGR